MSTTYDLQDVNEFVSVEDCGPGFALFVYSIDGDKQLVLIDSVRETVEKAAEAIRSTLRTWDGFR